jgi:hypothetical protein
MRRSASDDNGRRGNKMIKLTTENTQRAIERCKQLRPKFASLLNELFPFNQQITLILILSVLMLKAMKNSGICECKASEKGLVCYHIIGAATANIYRQSLKRQTA